MIVFGDVWGDVAAPTASTGVATGPAPPAAPVYTAAPTAPGSAPAAGPVILVSALAPSAPPPLSAFGRAWWATMRAQTTHPVVQALRVLMEGERPTAGPTVTDPRLASVGRGLPDPGEVYAELAWLFEWPDDLLLDVIPGATTARLAAARAALRPSLTAEQIRVDRIRRLRARRDGLLAHRAVLERMLEELAREQMWVATVMKQFDTYVRWFEHHQEKKDVRVANVSKVLQAVSTVVSFVPVVGTVIAIAITAVDVGIQYRRLRESIHDFGRAGGQIEAGLLAVAAMEATEVAGVDLLAAQQAVVVEIENLDAMLAVLDPRAERASTPADLPTVPAAPRRGGSAVVVVGLAALAALLWSLRR